jgi:pantoate--beta-alanine ligase
LAHKLSVGGRPIRTLISIKELQQFKKGLPSEAKLGFVPTMGALHAGHLSLVEVAKKNCDHVIVSIFVNPKQFGPSEDFGKYPRTLDADCQLLSNAGVSAVFLPLAGEIYPEGFQTFVINTDMARAYCGEFRPQFFGGVLTVVLKLLNIVGCTEVFFGKKDFQQYRLISRMVEDFSLPVIVTGSETVREPDGLALSSRNRYLSPEERAKALSISAGLSKAHALWKAGERKSVALVSVVEKSIQTAGGRIEYCSLADSVSLLPTPERVESNAVILVAAYFGDTRLIDNLELTVN